MKQVNWQVENRLLDAGDLHVQFDEGEGYSPASMVCSL